MADDFGASLKGLKDVDERLALLNSVAGERVVRSVIFAALKPILEQAVANIAAIPTGSGALARATRRVYMRPAAAASGSGTRFRMAVTPKTRDRAAIALANLYYKPRRPRRGVYWGHLVEWGFTTRSGRKVTGRLVFTRALDSRGSEAVAIFVDRIGVATERAIRKQNPAP